MIENLHQQGFVGVSGETFDGRSRKLVTQNMFVVHPSHIRYLQEAEETIADQKKRIVELESDNKELHRVHDEALFYLVRLAKYLVDEHYPENKTWEPLNTLNGVISQIDNTVTRWKPDVLALQSRIVELESALCETCKDPHCEDSVIEHLKQKVARYEKALREIAKADGECDCTFMYGSRFCPSCIAKKALGGGE
jgi:glycerol-3-phosphate cytidylyltransferase-like family protein